MKVKRRKRKKSKKSNKLRKKKIYNYQMILKMNNPMKQRKRRIKAIKKMDKGKDYLMNAS